MSSDLEVKIVELPPMRVASARGFGPSPEPLAFEKMLAWARAHNLLDGPEKPRFFGFNNPSPSTGSPNYGYEVWMTVGPHAEGEQGGDGISIKEVSAGLYAVRRAAGSPFEIFPRAWQELVTWVEQSPYEMDCQHECLEEQLNVLENPQENEMAFDLYLPVKK